MNYYWKKNKMFFSHQSFKLWFHWRAKSNQYWRWFFRQQSNRQQWYWRWSWILQRKIKVDYKPQNFFFNYLWLYYQKRSWSYSRQVSKEWQWQTRLPTSAMFNDATLFNYIHFQGIKPFCQGLQVELFLLVAKVSYNHWKKKKKVKMRAERMIWQPDTVPLRINLERWMKRVTYSFNYCSLSVLPPFRICFVAVHCSF